MKILNRSAISFLALMAVHYGAMAAEHAFNPKRSNPVFAGVPTRTELHFQDSISTEAFVRQAAIDGRKALLIGKIASTQAADARIKTFSQKMVSEQMQANDELSLLAKARKITLPMSRPQGGQRPDGRVDSAPENLQDSSRNKNAGGEAGNTGQVDKAQPVPGTNSTREKEITSTVDQLKGLSGTAFDQAYADMTLTDCKNSILLFEAGSKSTDALVKAYATKHLPKIKNDLEQLEAIRTKWKK